MNHHHNQSANRRLGGIVAGCAVMLLAAMPVKAADDKMSRDGNVSDGGSSAPAASPSQRNILIDPALLLSLVQQDWNRDGRLDKALLLRDSSDARQVALRIYLSDGSDTGYRLAGRHDAIGWAGQGEAGRPDLSASESGVTLRSGDSGSTKTPWHEVLSIDRRDDRFVVSRYTVNWHDKSDRRAGFRCDINLVTGSGIRNMASLESVPAPATLEKWQRDALPPDCRVQPGSP
jgi:hypothetical protein